MYCNPLDPCGTPSNKFSGMERGRGRGEGRASFIKQEGEAGDEDRVSPFFFFFFLFFFVVGCVGKLNFKQFN